jgi:integrase
MSAKPNRIPSYRLHKPSGQAVVRIEGRDYYLGKHGTEESQEAYRRLIAQWLSNGQPHTPAVRHVGLPSLSINEIILSYWRFAVQHYRKDGEPTSQQGRIRSALRPLRRLYGHTPACDFGPLALKAVRQAMIEDGWSRGFINSCVGCIKRLFKWSVENELVPPAVYQGVQAVAGLRKGRSGAKETRPVRPVPEPLVEAVLPLVSAQVGAMIGLQRLTGMRPEEVTAMRTCDIEMAGAEWAYRPASHKTEHHDVERVIFLGPRAQQVLRPWLRQNGEEYLFSPREAEETRNARRRARRATPLTPSQAKRRPKTGRKRPRRDHYDTDSYRQAIMRACRKAGVPHWHPNQLRHNRGTEIRKRYGLDAARAVLGHRSAEVTEVYAERDQSLAARVMGEIG